MCIHCVPSPIRSVQTGTPEGKTVGIILYPSERCRYSFYGHGNFSWYVPTNSLSIYLRYVSIIDKHYVYSIASARWQYIKF